MSEDRQYVRRAPTLTREYKAHVFVTWTRMPGTARGEHEQTVRDVQGPMDRLPPDWRLCGRCARIIAARTDVEEDPTMGVTT